jgi:AhpD family alkylhydroperoxidase
MERISFQEIPEGMYDKLIAIENFVSASSLDLQLLELIRLRVAQINGCAYCVDMHHKILAATGETDIRMSAVCIWQSTPYFTEKEKAALLFAEKLTKIPDNEISDEDFQLLQQHFNRDEICYLTLAVTQINTWTRFTETFRTTPGNYEVKTEEIIA